MAGKLILHIGTHKTGTTTLQSVLNLNPAALAANGIVYPKLSLKWEHAALNRNAYWLNMAALERIGSTGLQEPEKIGPWRELCAAALAEDKTVLLSDERIWFNATKKGYWEAMRAIMQEVGVTEVKLVLYLRRQDLFAESLWAQFVKTGRMQVSLSEYIAREKVVKVCDYEAGVKRIQKVFGAENLVIRVYDRSLLAGGDTAEDFLRTIGIEDTSAFTWPEEAKNPSLTPTMTAVKLQFNRSERYREVEKDFLSKHALLVSAHDEERKGSFLTPQERQTFLGQYAQGNEWIARSCLGSEDGRLFPVKEGELERPAFELDPLKVALLSCEVMASVASAEREQRIKETTKLNKRIDRLHGLEDAPKAPFLQRLKTALRILLGR